MLYFRDSSHFPVIGDLAMAYSPGIQLYKTATCGFGSASMLFTRRRICDLLRRLTRVVCCPILRSLSLHVYQITVTL